MSIFGEAVALPGADRVLAVDVVAVLDCAVVLTPGRRVVELACDVPAALDCRVVAELESEVVV